ncbi:MAG: 16S rRNA (cytosine(1402)-N(4))-methyltransferase RsmH [Candidatus Komeilibacteria bacterium]
MTEHVPVLLSEVIAGLQVKPNRDYIDCTLGAGGHARAVLKLNGPQGLLYGIDADKKALSLAQHNLQEFGSRVIYIEANYRTLENIVQQYKIANLNLGGIYVDLGLSSMQLAASDRGFSFQIDAPLDMSFGKTTNLTAAEIINYWSEEEIANILHNYGEEKAGRSIAKAIVKARGNELIQTTGQLVAIVSQVKGARRRHKIHPATKTFQALRIAVNDELNGLRDFLPQAINLLPSRARLAVIAYHSLEDRIVKNWFRQETRDCICPPSLPQCICGHQRSVKLITKKPIMPSAEEIGLNPRSRSAKLRIVEKI